MHRFNRLPIPLLLALAVAVGVSVIIVFQITVVPPPPAVVAPIETSATALTSGSTTYTISVSVAQGANVTYPTLAGMGKIQLQANTSGWYYLLQNDLFATVARRSTGNATYVLSNNYRIIIKEINSTHAVVYYDRRYIAVVTQKVQVGNTGWIIYHPVPTSYDSATLNTLRNIISEQRLTYIYVFQPLPDYVRYDYTNKRFYVYVDAVSSSSVTTKYNSYYNSTNFTPVPTSSPVTVAGITQIDLSNYVLWPIWALLYTQPNSNVNTALTITPVQ
jgi:hypothetical protein